MMEAFSLAVAHLADPLSLGLLLLGTFLGLVFGVLPGLSGATALAILIPLTYGLDPMTAMIFLAAVMGSVPFGGSISAILLNTPGSPINAATCLDGYPLARQGRGREALEMSAAASGFGALFGVMALLVVLPFVRRIVLLIGPPEIFFLCLFALVTTTLAVREHFLKGLVSAGLGLLLSFVGYSPIFGELRFTFGSEHLWDGFPAVAVFVGIFAVSELINFALRGGTVASPESSGSSRHYDGLREAARQKKNLVRSASVGTLIGIIPGVGGATANFVAYILAKKSSRHPETFGSGNPEGVVAPEAANNAKDGGALLPTLALGIPGSVMMAVLLGAFVLHGLKPGPALLQERLDIVLALVLGLAVSSVLASAAGLLSARFLARLTRIPVATFFPVVLSLCFVGSYSLRENIWDVLLTLIFGFLGYGMSRYGFPKIGLVIGMILGVLMETAFHQSLMMSYGSLRIFVSRPLSLMFLILFLSSLLLPVLRSVRDFRRKRP